MLRYLPVASFRLTSMQNYGGGDAAAYMIYGYCNHYPRFWSLGVAFTDKMDTFAMT